MTAVPASPQAARDRLLQAIDSQNNVCNMAVVLDVISFLEKYPITKEALEQTRLGKLINDIRRKSKNPDLAKRAKSLVRSWQKLIQPVEASTKIERKVPRPEGVNCPIISSSLVSPSRKTVCELKTRSDYNNNSEKPKTKCKTDHDAQPATKLSKTTPDRGPRLKLSNASNGISSLKANGLHSNKPLSTSLLLKASVIQQQAATREQRSKKKRKRQPPCNDNISQTNSEPSKPVLESSILVKCSNEGKRENSGRLLVPNSHFTASGSERTDWKELSKSESIQTYLNHQSSMLSSEAKVPKFSCLLEEVRGDQSVKADPERCDFPAAVGTQVSAEDVERLHTQRWAGVNGCFDARGNWSDWTQSVSVDAHEDGSRLEVLPYVCLD
uniref:Mediator of RNA polymerase II transcription subunit 26 n=1 Tax=Neogobius melanostomus TaxID=47308 RepID=A0A8C6SSN5_9GOBI